MDHKHKLLYCAIPKIGSTTFVHYLWELNTVKHSRGFAHPPESFFEKTGVWLLKDLSQSDRERAMNEYFRFIVVRHPFDRLYSAWRNMFYKSNISPLISGTIQTVISDLLNEMDPDSKYEDVNYSMENITFNQFLYLVSVEVNSGFQLHQYASMYAHCLPCDVTYDHVFRLETLAHDVTSLYEHLRMNNRSETIPDIRGINNRLQMDSQQKLTRVSELYKNVSSEVTRGLARIYKRDLELFGYHWRNHNASCSWTHKHCC